MKQKLVLVAAVLVGLLAFWLSGHYLRSERARLYRGAEQIQILAAGRDLPAGAVIAMEDLGTLTVFKSAVGENVFRPEDLDRVVGKKLRFTLRRREPLWWSHVEMPSRLREGLAPMIRSGLRAVSIAVGGEAAVSGLVQPNDRVDILASFTFPARDDPEAMESVTLTLLQDVTILATGQQLAREDWFGEPRARPSHGYNTVTLEVTLREAELLVFVQQMKGRLSLALRHPEDVGFETDLPEVNFRYLEHSLPELNQYRQRHIRHKREL